MTIILREQHRQQRGKKGLRSLFFLSGLLGLFLLLLPHDLRVPGLPLLVSQTFVTVLIRGLFLAALGVLGRLLPGHLTLIATRHLASHPGIPSVDWPSLKKVPKTLPNVWASDRILLPNNKCLTNRVFP